MQMHWLTVCRTARLTRRAGRASRTCLGTWGARGVGRELSTCQEGNRRRWSRHGRSEWWLCCYMRPWARRPRTWPPPAATVPALWRRADRGRLDSDRYPRLPTHAGLDLAAQWHAVRSHCPPARFETIGGVRPNQRPRDSLGRRHDGSQLHSAPMVSKHSGLRQQFAFRVYRYQVHRFRELA